MIGEIAECRVEGDDLGPLMRCQPGLDPIITYIPGKPIEDVKRELGLDDVIKLAIGAKGEDAYGHRAEFVNLVRQAKSAAALQQQKN